MTINLRLLMEGINVIDAGVDEVLKYGICGYKNTQTPGFLEKVEWLKKRFAEGMKVKLLYSEKERLHGMIEYIPGKYAWRPVDAKGFMFIHCIFVGFKKIYQGRGYGSMLLEECIKDTESAGLKGVAVVTRKGSFMADKDLFIKKGFEIVDTAKPDFELLALKFDDKAASPIFIPDLDKHIADYGDDLTIIRADQCPYTVKNVNEIAATAENRFGIKAKVVELKSCGEAQRMPCPFGVFCILYKGKIIAHHPISNTRFINIFSKIK
jgi:ribosomal protein S18 acetylase RimI-like enzyme